MKSIVTAVFLYINFFNSMKKIKKFNLPVLYTRCPVSFLQSSEPPPGTELAQKPERRLRKFLQYYFFINWFRFLYQWEKMSQLELSTPNHKSSFLHKIQTEISLELLFFWLLF